MCSLTLASCAPQMPQTRKDPTTDEYFGTTVPDPYRWLEDDLSPETAARVEAQNKYTDHYLKGIPFRGKLLERLKQVNDYEKVGAPVRRKNGELVRDLYPARRAGRHLLVHHYNLKMSY